ncbi:hypothetical protein OL157_005018 [Escherichia coli]|nr:hypothetical protein [Escherichia coli]
MALSDIALKRSVTRSERFFDFTWIYPWLYRTKRQRAIQGFSVSFWGGGIAGSVDLCIVEMMWSHKSIGKRTYHVDIKGI